MRFVLTIDMGNAAMSNAADVADALSSAADAVREHYSGARGVGMEEPPSGSVRDANGNTVGAWRFTTDEHESAPEELTQRLAAWLIDNGWPWLADDLSGGASWPEIAERIRTTGATGDAERFRELAREHDDR
jgi:hypothetical protein